MIKILHIISSPRGDKSYSFNLGKSIVTKIIRNNNDYKLTERRLTDHFLPFLSSAQILAFYKNPEWRNDEEKNALIYSDIVIEEIQNADVIVISTPMYNLGIPAALKAWIDQIIRVNVTFSFNAEGAKIALLGPKKVYLAIASGTVHTDKSYETDFIESYMKFVLKPIGIQNIKTYRIEGTAYKDHEKINYDELIGRL